MIIDLILGWLIGKYAAKNKKMAVIMGAVCGAVLGTVAVKFLLTPKDNPVSPSLLLIMAAAEALITALMAGIIVHNKMQKQARRAQAFSD